MAWFIAHSLVVIVLAALLGLLMGWLWWGKRWSQTASRRQSAPRPAVIPAAKAPLATEPMVETSEPPALEIEPVASTDQVVQDTIEAEPQIEFVEPEPVDNLQLIEGIGPRIAAALQAAEIRTFEAVAAADSEQLAHALRSAGLSFAPSASTWPDQAAMLLEGDEAGLTALKHRLVPERDHATAGGTPAEGIAADDVEPDPEAEDDSPDQDGSQTAVADGATGVNPTDDSPQVEADAVVDNEAADEDLEDDDDLERIEGIGPRIAAALQAAQLKSYRTIAAAEPATLQAALEAAGLRFAPSLPTWPDQANLLAAGDVEGHAKLTASLVSGSNSERKN